MYLVAMKCSDQYTYEHKIPYSNLLWAKTTYSHYGKLLSSMQLADDVHNNARDLLIQCIGVTKKKLTVTFEYV